MTNPYSTENQVVFENLFGVYMACINAIGIFKTGLYGGCPSTRVSTHPNKNKFPLVPLWAVDGTVNKILVPLALHST